MQPYYHDDRLTIYNADNLAVLWHLVDQRQRFDLVELDGPYAAGLEGWDCLTEDEYLAHYTARLPLVRDAMQPWGVSFLFGYPEGCAEIKTWARQSGTLHLRRWLTWYKQRTMHKGRKCETVLVFLRDPIDFQRLDRFRVQLRAWRGARSLEWLGNEATRRGHVVWWHRGGNMYFETGSGDSRPSLQDYCILSDIFGFDAEEWSGVIDGSYEGLTNLDYLNPSYPEDTREINDAGLRSKPVGLYLDLFRPTIPPRDEKRALVLYGGSGNAAIAAGQLGYSVTVCETDPARCEYIRRRWAWKVERRDETPIEELGPMFASLAPEEAA